MTSADTPQYIAWLFSVICKQIKQEVNESMRALGHSYIKHTRTHAYIHDYCSKSDLAAQIKSGRSNVLASTGNLFRRDTARYPKER